MPSPGAKNDFTNSILFAALCLSFNPREKSMAASELMRRNFVPTKRLCRHYLCRLIKSGVIKVHLSPRNQPETNQLKKNKLKTNKQVHKRELIIKNPSMLDSMLSRMTVMALRNAQASLLESSVHHEERDELILEVQAGECVEYVEYYEKYEATGYLKICDKDPFNPQLQQLLLRNELEQVFTLISESIKKLNHKSILSFPELIDAASELYLENIRRELTIPHCNRPEKMHTSRVAGILLADFKQEKGKAITNSND